MQEKHTTSRVVMISPDHFGFNEQTAESNLFQNRPVESPEQVQAAALAEFRQMVALLRLHGVQVLTLPSKTDHVTPDALFPNNWFSHHSDGRLVLYPMLTPNRQAERQPDELQAKLAEAKSYVTEVIDFSNHEQHGDILEGTGSMVLDRANKVAFAMSSPRTDEKLFAEWCRVMGYEGIFFHAYDPESLPIYHTNVMMSIGQKFAVVCLESIVDELERQLVETKLKQLGKEVIDISIEQLFHLCGNILQLQSQMGQLLIVMSQDAHDHFTPEQRQQLEKHGKLVTPAIPTIERVGGGGVRCMIAEVF